MLPTETPSISEAREQRHKQRCEYGCEKRFTQRCGKSVGRGMSIDGESRGKNLALLVT
jgi:hypothetical protein